MNLLLTCVGRRGHLVDFFKEALHGRGKVVACDSSADAPALKHADVAAVVPSFNHPEYLDILHGLCLEHEVELVIPALEPELPLLARQRDRFRESGITLVVSSREVVDLCYDKVASSDFLERCGLKTMRTCLSLEEAREAIARGELEFPLIVKPRWGTTSIGTEQAEDLDELEMVYRLARKRLAKTFLAEISNTDPERCMLIQERLNGEEYGLDVVNDLEGNHVRTFVKRKLRMRAGQTDRAITVCHEELERLGRIIGENLRHTWILDCDVFVTAEGCYVLDMNPRLGGGYPFSHLAGANLPAALVAWQEGRLPDESCYGIEPGVCTARTDTFRVINPKAKPARDHAPAATVPQGLNGNFIVAGQCPQPEVIQS